ncbi:MAG: TIGR01777 family oxidoreductase [Balneolaceae bacterium]
MNILITGGTGFIGEELRTILLREGHNIIIVTRDPKKHEGEAAKNQRFIGWDDDLSAEMNEVNAVINLAGENIFGQRWTDEVKERIMSSRIESTRQLVEAMEKAENKPGVFISASASGIYGDHGEEILDEDSQTANDFLADVCIKWEAESQKATDFGVRVVNPRMGIVLEKGGGALKQMVPPFQFFVGGPVGSGNQYMSWIHRTDLCHSFLFMIKNEQLKGACNTCSPEPVTMNKFAQILGDILNRPSFFRVPKFALDLALGESAKPITDSIRMQPKKLQIVNFDFSYESLEEALAEIL